jgi:hypothetical protein
MIDRNSNKKSKLWLKPAVLMIRSELCLYTNLYKYFRQVCFLFILHSHQHLNGPAKIRFPPTGLVKALHWWVFLSIICFCITFISDIDDTIKITGVTSSTETLINTCRSDFRSVSDMSNIYISILTTKIDNIGKR